MDSGQIIRLLMRLFRPLINRGINSGVDYVARRGKPAAEMTPDERAQADAGKKMARRARQLSRLGRRAGR